MKIGDFAKACGTSISVLRHYDRLGLLSPVYVDRFTEYRYYDISQAAVYKRIKMLKNAGFSLSEIALMLQSESAAEELFVKKKAELAARLHHLESAKQMMIGEIVMQNFKPLYEDVNLPFENDEQAIGKWQIVKNDANALSVKGKYMYFLPNGERYWGYSWTKGKFIVNFRETRYSNNYRIERRGDEIYMIIDCKTPDYERTGETVAVVCRKVDGKHYSKQDIARKDNINLPFIGDDGVIGTWKFYCLLHREQRDRFLSEAIPSDDGRDKDPFYKQIEFLPNGKCVSLYAQEKRVEDSYTKGFVLRKGDSTACAYEIAKRGDGLYLLLEWKSGDWIFGGRDPNYYVFVKN